MDYFSLKENMKAAKRPKSRASRAGSPETLASNLLASKLFSYLICHGEDCRLSISRAAKRLQKFSDGKSYDSKKTLALVNSFREKFVVKNVEGTSYVEARTTVKICDAFQQGKCKAGGCKDLHICRFFLEGIKHILTHILLKQNMNCVARGIVYILQSHALLAVPDLDQLNCHNIFPIFCCY